MMSEIHSTQHKHRNLNKQISILLSIFALTSLFTFSIVHSAPGDILYQNSFDSQSELDNDWTREGGSSDNDFEPNSSASNSGGSSLRIRDESGGVTDSGLIDASGVSELELSLWVQSGTSNGTDPNSGDDLVLYYSDSSGSFNWLYTFPGSASASTVFEEVITLPADALHDDLRFRLDMIDGGNNNRWYVDDFIVREPVDSAPTPVAYWSMDEPSWGAVVDQIGAYNGTAFNGANTTGSTSCRYGEFDGINDYIEIPHDNALNGSNALTYVAYIRPDSWTGVDQIIAKSVHGGGSGRAQMGLFSESGVFKGRAETNRGRVEITSSLPAVAGDWIQVALVFDGTSLTLYQDAVAVATRTFSSRRLNSNTDPINISKRVGSSAYYFDGLIDEVRVYTEALTQQDIQDLYDSITPCPLSAAVDYIEIITDGSALTCTSEEITLRACADSDCSSVATEDVVVTLAATGSATWSTNPVTIPANSSSGVSVILTDRTAETVTVSVSSTSVATTGTSPQCSNGTCQVAFADSGFLLSLPNHNSCAGSTLSIQAVQLSDTSNSCVPVYTGNQSVGFSFSYTNPATGSITPLLDTTAMASAGSTQTRTINFNSSAAANLPFSYDDAGQLSLTVTDQGANGLTSATVNTIVTPAQLLVFTNDINNACAGPDYASCTAFKTAGIPGDVSSEFDLTVSGACADDTVTPNFELSGIGLSANLIAPAAGTNGSVGVSSVDITANGTTTVSQTISEVGVFSITATPASYLGQSIPAATSSNIGRFTPARFLISDNSPMLDDATCDFTYQDQDTGFAPGLAPEITVTAVNSNDITTLNYGGDGVANNDFWKFNSADYSARVYSNQATPYSGSITATLNAVVIAGETDYDGTHSISFNNDTITHNKAAATPQNTNDAPFDAELVLSLSSDSLTDTDNIFYDSDSNSVADDYQATTIDGTNIRWGRWSLENGFGSELRDISMNLTAQYFNGTQFVTASSDNCTSTVVIALSNYIDNLSIGETTVSQTAITGGIIPISLSAPGAGNTGSVSLTITTPSWLTYDYDGDAVAENVLATATFGIYQGRRPIIIRRQTY